MDIMLDVHQKRKVRSVLYNRITLGVLLVLVVLFMHSTWVVYRKKQTSAEMKNISLRQTEELKARDRELQEQIGRLNTPAGVEQEIRSKFNVAKPQENMVVIVDDQSATAVLATTSKPGFFRRILDFFTK